MCGCLQALELVTARYLAQLMPLLLPQCWAADAATRLLALQALTQLLRCCWPRIPAHAGKHSGDCLQSVSTGWAAAASGPCGQSAKST